MKRVLFVDQSQVLGGAELSLIDICQQFPNSSVAVFAAGDFSDRLATLNIDHRILAVPKALTDVKRAGGVVSEIAALPALIRTAVSISRIAREFDVIYANTQKAMLAGAIAGRLSRKPVIWHLRDLMTAEHFGKKLIRASVTVANRFVDTVIANSNATKDAFVRAGGNAAMVTTVHNGIYSAQFINQADSRLAFCRELNIDGLKVAGIFSRISDWKGQHLLIEALVDRKDWAALIVGDALFQNDHEYKTRLQSLVASNSLESRVHFLGFRDDVPNLMSACDVVVHASTSPEPFGRVIVEGMLARSVVIAANAGGAREIIRHGENGFLFDPMASDSLGATLDMVTDHPDTESIIDRAYHEALTYYSVDRMVEEIKEVVASLESVKQ